MRSLITLLCLLVFTSSSIFADDVENSLMELQEKKKSMILNSFDLSDTQSEVFWNVYADYEKEIGNIKKEEFELIKKYNAKYNDNSISEQSSSNMLAHIFRIQGRELQIKQIYLGKFQEVLPKVEVLRFYQIDNKVNALLGDEFSKLIPLAGTDL